MSFKSPRVSPSLAHVPTIISGSNLRSFCWGGGECVSVGVFLLLLLFGAFLEFWGFLVVSFCFFFFFNQYVLDGSSSCESCQPVWSWTGRRVNFKHWEELGPHRRKRPRKQLITWRKKIVVEDEASDYLIKTKLKILSASSRILRSQWMSNIYLTTSLGDYLNWKWSWKKFLPKTTSLVKGKRWNLKEGGWEYASIFGFVSQQCSLDPSKNSLPTSLFSSLQLA